MTKKVKIVLLCLYLGLLLVCGILSVLSGNELVSSIFGWTSILLFFFGAIFMFTVIFIVGHKNKRLMHSFIENKDYAMAKKVFESKNAKCLAYGSKVISWYYILISSFALNDIKTARELLSKTKWMGLSVAVKYYEILLNLKDNELELARSNYEIFSKKAKKISVTHVNKIRQIFACIDNNNFDDKFYLDSINPIVKEIYDFYSSKNQ